MKQLVSDYSQAQENNVAEHKLSGVMNKYLSEPQKQQLRGILERGLPIVAKPYLHIAKQISATENQVLQQIEHWQTDGLVKRFGLVVKHRQLGYNANAMVVWNIEDSQVDSIAKMFSSCPEVSLCYRRPRRLPDWPYNLFCMIHGTDRSIVLAQIDAIVAKFSLEHIEKDVLFSFKAYKQQGARYGKKGLDNG